MARRLQSSTSMSPSSSSVRQAIEPIPTVPLGASQHPGGMPTERVDDSIAPVASPDGFASDARDRVGRSGVPWEIRPLSSRGILAWTIGAMAGAALLVTSALVASSREASKDEHSAALHGAESVDAPAAIQISAASAYAPQGTEPRVQAAPVTALEDLPKMVATVPHRRTTSSATLTGVPSRASRIDQTTSGRTTNSPPHTRAAARADRKMPVTSASKTLTRDRTASAAR